MSMLSTPRYLVQQAPAGLSLVQELLNTAASGKPRLPDLLDTVPLAQAWLDHALAHWASETGQPAPGINLQKGDLPALRNLRHLLYVARTQEGRRDEEAPESLTVPIHVTLSVDDLAIAPTHGSATKVLQAAVVAECFRAKLDGDWRRLKICAHPRCNVAFFDRSRNASGVWHDVHICGNAINLKASRARRGSVAR